MVKFKSNSKGFFWWVAGEPSEVKVGWIHVNSGKRVFDVYVKYVGKPYETPVGMRVRGYFDTCGHSAESTMSGHSAEGLRLKEAA
jgi:hypothetical protein